MTMHDRSDRVPLPASEPRCEPSTGCVIRGRCARYQAALPAQGAIMSDYSITQYGGSALCPGYLSVHTLMRQTPEPRHVPVHPAPRGI